MALIQVKDLTVKYDDQVVLDHLSFSVNQGDYLAIIGSNGSGKTTLMRTLLGLLKPTSGSITFEDGFSFKKIGYLPQKKNIQKDFPATVEEVVQSGCLNHLGNHIFYDKKHKEHARENMERLQIQNYAKKSFMELSGGQQQRVLLARALCAGHSLLLLDEPVTGLDPTTTKDLYQLIHKLNKEGLTILMISHDIEEVSKYASHILSIENDYQYNQNMKVGETK
ncbi:MAG: ABC transporter ATP-binding protein [Solobacterium sp.]|nr:ABC transporter ATP-binding protein [Solobacterium sp.]